MFVKSIAIWIVLVIMAILNGLLRDLLLSPLLGNSISLFLSGLTLSTLVFLVSYLSVRFIGVTRLQHCILIGFFWVLLTLSFEYLFAHYVVGKSWQDINQIFNLEKGDLFIVVLIITALSPWFAAKLRKLI